MMRCAWPGCPHGGPDIIWSSGNLDWSDLHYEGLFESDSDKAERQRERCRADTLHLKMRVRDWLHIERRR